MSIESQDSLDFNFHTLESVAIKHRSKHLLTIVKGVEWWFCQQDAAVLGVDVESGWIDRWNEDRNKHRTKKMAGTFQKRCNPRDEPCPPCEYVKYMNILHIERRTNIPVPDNGMADRV